MNKPSIDLQKLTQTRVTMPLIFIAALVVFGFRFEGITVNYLGDFFVSKVVAEEQYKEITRQVSANAKLIKGHIRTMELNDNAKETKNAQNQIYNLELYVAANGENDLTRTRQRDLQHELDKLGRVRACIIRNDPDENCKAII